jgi:hypothetical protein
MLRIAEALPPQPTALWSLVQQCGVKYVVGTFAGSRGISLAAALSSG